LDNHYQLRSDYWWFL